MPQSIPKGLAREHVLRALLDLDAGVEHPFGAPTGYELVHGGRRYPPKAVIGLAYRHLTGRMLRPEEFSGGEAPGQANYVLREMGFAVEKKSDESEMSEEVGRDWTPEEVGLIVADYFEMLRLDHAGQTYSKAGHNRSLREGLNARSKGSVEFKHQNISAVLLEMGLPYMGGYKPARNYQRTVLPQAIEGYLTRHPDFFDTLADGAVLNPVAAPTLAERPVEEYFEGRPERIVVPPGG